MDARDVLDLPASAPKPTPPRAKKIKTEKKLDGLQRELYSLLGENAPPVVVTQHRFRDKPNWRQKVSPWTWARFENPARSDGLVLHHWIKGSTAQDDEPYSFSKYNKSVTVPEITDKALYDEILEDSENGWTFEETNYLLDLCRDYDLRWVVIHDVYNWKRPSTTQSNGEAENSSPQVSRTLEDLKARFYDISRALLKHENPVMSPDQQDKYKQLKFSKEAEKRRKDHLESLLARSPAEIAEEEALVIESRKLEVAAERMLTERSEIVRLLDTPQASASITQYTNSQGIAQFTNQLLAEKSKKRKEDPASEQSTASPPVKSESATPTVKSESLPRKGAVSLASATAAQAVQAATQRRLTARDEAAYGISYHDKLSQGVYLRSSKISTFKPALAAKLTQVLAELELPVKPAMPTAKVCAKFESLQQSIGVLLEAKRQADKLETELKVLSEAK